MPLKSYAFADDPRLNTCLVNDAAHVIQGATGYHVRKIQAVLKAVDGASIADAEWEAMKYGPSTAAAVLAFKEKRGVVNRSYQTKADNIVGKMTIAALDSEIHELERTVMARPTRMCKRRCGCNHPDRVTDTWRQRLVPQLGKDRVFASLGSSTGFRGTVGTGTVAAPTLPRQEAEFFKPRGIFDGGFDPKQPFQMIPVSGFRQLGVKTGDQNCILRVESLHPGTPLTLTNIRANPPIPSNSSNRIESVFIPARTLVHFQVIGWQEGSGMLVLRNELGVAQKALFFSVKSPKTLNVGARILSDIRRRQAKRTIPEAVEAIVAASDFFEKWANVKLNLVGDPVMTKALIDLGDVINMNDNRNWQAIIKAPVVGSNPEVVPREEIINIFFTWNIEVRHSDPGMRTFGTTAYNWCVVEDANIEPRLSSHLVVKHEIGHALGLAHHSSAPSLMAENSFSMVESLLMHEINTVNTSGTAP